MGHLITRTLLAAVAAACVSCTAPPAARPLPAPTPPPAEGTIIHISSGHGNAYTTLGPDQYEPLGLKPGTQIRVTFGETTLTLPVERTYTDVPSGTPLAVLHREGLTFAICDGNFSATYAIAVGTPFILRRCPALTQPDATD